MDSGEQDDEEKEEEEEIPEMEYLDLHDKFFEFPDDLPYGDKKFRHILFNPFRGRPPLEETSFRGGLL